MRLAKRYLSLTLLSVTTLYFHVAIAVDSPTKLTAQAPIVLKGPAAHFDFMATDSENRRILAAHKGAGTLEILDLTTKTPLASIRTGDIQGVVVDSRHHTYYLGSDDGQTVIEIDSRSLKIIASLKMDGPVDGVAYDFKHDLIFAAKDASPVVWVIDRKSMKLKATINLPGAPEYIEYSEVSDRVYVNIKDKDLVSKINPATFSIEASWSTLPATGPHGLAVDKKRPAIYVAGKNGKLVAISTETGKVTSNSSIAEGVDQIAIDDSTNTIFSAAKRQISLSVATTDGLKFIDSFASPAGAHTIAVDASNHGVWVTYSDEKHSYFQQFTAK